MSQGALEAALGRLLCDDGFRREFRRDSEGAAVRAGFRLTAVEIASLRKIESDAFESFVIHIDDRVRRAEAPRSRHSST